MTKGPGHRIPGQTRAMTVKAVAVRYWFPLTGEIEAMCIGTRDCSDTCLVLWWPCALRCTSHSAQRSIIMISTPQRKPADWER